MAMAGANVVRIKMILEGVDEVRNGADAVSDKFKEVKSDIEEVGRRLRAMGTAGILALGGFLTAVTLSADSFNRFRLGIRNFVEGDADALATAIDKFAIASAFQGDVLRRVSQMLLGYGVAAKDVLRVLREITDVTAAAGLTSDELFRVALAYGQVVAQGRLYGQELRQLAQAGIPVDKMLRKIGLSLAQIRDEGVTLSAEQFQKAFSEFARQFEGAQERLAMGSLVVQLQNLWEAIAFFMRPIGQMIIGVLGSIALLAQIIINLLGKIPPGIRALLGIVVIVGLFGAFVQMIILGTRLLGKMGIMMAFINTSVRILYGTFLGIINFKKTIVALTVLWGRAVKAVAVAYEFLQSVMTMGMSGLIRGLLKIVGAILAVIGIGKIFDWVMDRMGLGAPTADMDKLERDLAQIEATKENTEAVKDLTKTIKEKGFGFGDRAQRALTRSELWRLLAPQMFRV
jgi:tape measure domain-containing protein